MDPATSQRQVERLKEVRLSRNQGKVAESLQELRKAAQGTENLMPYILTAVKAYATLGEICGVLRDVFGEYQQQITI
jgi:methylmalonyl-CoA mutase, N-terminal domain